MKIISIKTKKIQPGDDLLKILDQYLPSLQEKSVVAITSKIIAITEGRVKKSKNNTQTKDEWIIKEAEYYLPRESNKYQIMLTIKNNILIPTSGIDESNSNGNYVFWPKDPQKSANLIRTYLKKRFALKNIGVIITDSKTTPLRWGVTGVAISHSGFDGLNDLIGKSDIFGKELRVTKVNVMDALAASAVLVMGESDEQTPIAVIEDLPFVQFVDRNPTQKELDDLKIALEDDLYGIILTSAPWIKGGNK